MKTICFWTLSDFVLKLCSILLDVFSSSAIFLIPTFNFYPPALISKHCFHIFAYQMIYQPMCYFVAKKQTVSKFVCNFNFDHFFLEIRFHKNEASTMFSSLFLSSCVFVLCGCISPSWNTFKH